MGWIDELNKTKLVIVVSMTFLVVDGLLLYNYQAQLAKDSGALTSPPPAPSKPSPPTSEPSLAATTSHGRGSGQEGGARAKEPNEEAGLPGEKEDVLGTRRASEPAPTMATPTTATPTTAAPSPGQYAAEQAFPAAAYGEPVHEAPYGAPYEAQPASPGRPTFEEWGSTPPEHPAEDSNVLGWGTMAPMSPADMAHPRRPGTEEAQMVPRWRPERRSWCRGSDENLCGPRYDHAQAQVRKASSDRPARSPIGAPVGPNAAGRGFGGF
jgi:hypothetical protein